MFTSYTDRAFVATHRGDHNPPRVAIQLGSLRLLRILFEDIGQVPVSALRFSARHFSFSDHEEMIAECARSEGRGDMLPASAAIWLATFTDPGIERHCGSSRNWRHSSSISPRIEGRVRRKRGGCRTEEIQERIDACKWGGTSDSVQRN
ncbi:DUF4158 domain-containing protein [Chelativorans sp. M5D2P16]|uniref:DUF4158 domain-containing protein n=1 Tax=Chelativorans sp. M5D2P16 TaxID=3095678 RepID=UPI003A100D09